MMFVKNIVWQHNQSINYKGGDCSVLLVSVSTPVSVIRKVCSNWADLCPSAVTAVQLSGHVISLCTPALIIGSMVKICPGFIKPVALLLA